MSFSEFLSRLEDSRRKQKKNHKKIFFLENLSHTHMSSGKRIWNNLLRDDSSDSLHESDCMVAKTPGIIPTRTRRRRTLSGNVASASKKSAIRRSRNEGNKMKSIIEGYLVKRGKGYMSTLKWRKRFFRLTGGPPYQLQYFRKNDVQCRRMIRQFTIQPGCYVERLNLNSFRIRFPDKNQGRSKLDLSGETEKHCMIWLTTISRVIQDVNTKTKVEQLKHSLHELREENHRLATERYSKRASRYWKIGGTRCWCSKCITRTIKTLEHRCSSQECRTRTRMRGSISNFQSSVCYETSTLL